MTINMQAFTPLMSLTGGVVIGVAVVMLALFCGRIAGISGILGGLLGRTWQDKGWRLAFVLGMFAAPWLYRLAAPLPEIAIATPMPWLVVSGLLVGFGTRYGSGCTSGHGVCGLSRLSLRSLVATLTFMGAAFVTVLVLGMFR
ncbi:YeeE/YedE family protein [Dickeya dadantii]|uniref:YeeE/YedE family protein n=1 Tax=Dickeya dadantii TaxID=204038 RepID=UPI0003A3755B|nr:YeeE/YedE thiosulfate transporter family protein [Dickeya dadantii]NPE49663.1 YeeE/YedE family protein [Dickeya dadantii]NPE55355.1 YeeE/YedE family protein [Dickeya dadantii]NPE61341.1 YeeE/YedE family protein [Dickeya dadantii]NPE67468.1 YeeE/YedE family protein [Dickeya dadantii]NPE71710.1 YeeE/YedE family protein [Dickeya dadantii]